MTGGLPSQWEPEAGRASPIPADSAGRGRGFPGRGSLFAPASVRGRRLPQARPGEAGREGWSPGVGCCVLDSGTAMRDLAQGFAWDVVGFSAAGPVPKAGRGSCTSLDPREGGTEETAAWGLEISGALGCSCPRFWRHSPWDWPPAHIHRRGGAVNCPGPNLSQWLHPCY